MRGSLLPAVALCSALLLPVGRVGLKDIDRMHVDVGQLFGFVFGVVAGRIEAERREPNGYSRRTRVPHLTVFGFCSFWYLDGVRATLGLLKHVIPQLQHVLFCVSGSAVRAG